MNKKALLEERMKCIAQARAIFEKANEEKRAMTTEEQNNFDTLISKGNELKKSIEQIEALETEERAINEAAVSTGPEVGLKATKTAAETRTEFELRTNVCGDTRKVMLINNAESNRIAADFRKYLVTGRTTRDLQMDDDTSGGYLSAPQNFIAELIKAVDDATFMRSLCRVLPPLTSAQSLGAPSLDNDPADPTWTSELAVGNEDSTMSFGKREMKPYPLAQYIKISKTLVRNASMGVEALIRSRLAYKMGIVQEYAFLNGSGANQPLGVFTASSNGISTDRDASTGNTETAIMFDGLKEAQYTLKPQYRNKAVWLFHTDALKQISKLKDGEGRYIWEPSVKVGSPDSILGRPFYESQYAPNTFTSGLYVGILGDFSNYWIVDALTFMVQAVLELYAVTNQNGYFARSETDGMPILEEAFVRVTLD